MFDYVKILSGVLWIYFAVAFNLLSQTRKMNDRNSSYDWCWLAVEIIKWCIWRATAALAHSFANVQGCIGDTWKVYRGYMP